MKAVTGDDTPAIDDESCFTNTRRAAVDPNSIIVNGKRIRVRL